MKPLCFDSEYEFDNWLTMNQLIEKYYKRSSNDNYCMDCTPEYANKMRAEGRCAHPEAKFVKIEDKYEGVLNESHGKKLEIAERKRLSSIHNGTLDAVSGHSSETRPVRFLRHIVLNGKRSVGGTDDKPSQHECTSEEDNRVRRAVIRT